MLLDCIIVSSGVKTARKAIEFGKTHVVRPKGRHQATVVWLHGLGDNGARFSSFFLSFCSFLNCFYYVQKCFDFVRQLVAALGDPSPTKCKNMKLIKLFTSIYTAILHGGKMNLSLELLMQIKWICPTAPTRPIALFGGFPSTACKLY